MVGEMAVNLAEEFFDFAAELAVEPFGECTGGTVAAIHGNFHGPCKLDVGGDAFDVFGHDVVAALGALACKQFAFFDAQAQALDGFIRQGLVGDDHLEAVVVGRIVAAGNHDAGMRAQMLRGEINDRRRDQAQVDDMQAAVADAA